MEYANFKKVKTAIVPDGAHRPDTISLIASDDLADRLNRPDQVILIRITAINLISSAY